jgi:tyrosine aminotransferase
MGANGIIQGALASILKNSPQAFFEETVDLIKDNVDYTFKALLEVPGLKPVKPSGAMYMMVGIDMHCFPGMKNDLEFVERMVSEESVFCLPGQCFDCPDYVRLVLTLPPELTVEACTRIAQFCRRHFVACNGVNGFTT